MQIRKRKNITEEKKIYNELMQKQLHISRNDIEKKIIFEKCSQVDG